MLAGIGEAESDHGRSDAPGVHSGENAAGAAGPMQFGIGGLAGDTWGGAPIHPASERTGGYGIDGDHDGIVDVYDPGDAIPSAAAFLKATALPPASRRPCWPTTTPTGTSLMSWAGQPAMPPAAPRSSPPQAARSASRLTSGRCPPGTPGRSIAYAEAQLGKPYQWGATGPDAFDCSGLAMMAYRAAGLTIPRTSQEQWAAGPRIPASQARPGDLVFFAGSDGTMTAPGHVGIVTGPGTMIDAPYTGQVIREKSFSSSTDLVGFTRP